MRFIRLGEALNSSGGINTPTGGKFFNPHTLVLDEQAVLRALKRIAHEIIENNQGLEDVGIVGLQTGGLPFAEVIAENLAHIENTIVPVGSLDTTSYRDDAHLRAVSDVNKTNIPFDVSQKNIILVDDVLFTGRTARAALDAIVDLGRPRRIQLAVMVDRGHRELPISPDYVGKNLPTRKGEAVTATLNGVEIGEMLR